MRISVLCTIVLMCICVCHTAPQCKCPETTRSGVGRKVYFDRAFNYAVKAKLISHNKIHAGPAVITLNILEVLKMKSVKISKGTNLTLWVENGCVCPDINIGETYLFLGYEDRNHKRLLFDEDCIAVKWKQRWPGHIKKWEARLALQHTQPPRPSHERRNKYPPLSSYGNSLFLNSDGNIIDKPLSSNKRTGRRKNRRRKNLRSGILS